MKTYSKLWNVVLIFLILGCLLIPAIAQDNPTEVPTVQQPVMTVPLQEVPVVQQPVIQPVVMQPTNQTTQNETPLISLDLYDIFIGLVVIIGALVMVWQAARRSGGDPAKFDRDVAAGFDAQRQDPEKMARLQALYDESKAGQKQLIDLFAGIFGTVSPYTTGIQADDALARWLRAIQSGGGAPAMAGVPGTPGVEVNVTGVPVPGYIPPVQSAPVQAVPSVPQQPLPNSESSTAG